MPDLNNIVTVHFDLIDWVVGVPFPHLGLHPRLHGRCVGAWLVTARPSVPVSGGQVEVGSGNITLENIGNLEALSRVFGAGASSDSTSISADVGLSSSGDISERKVSTESVDVAIAGPKLEEISLGVISLTEASEP